MCVWDKGDLKMTIKKEDKLLPLNLQFFAEDPPSDPPADPPEDPPKNIEMTKEELEKQIEAESDRKLNSALEKKQKEWESETDKRIKKALEEKERLSKLSEKEREEEQLTQREKDIAARESEIERKVLRSEAVDDLQKKELPADFAGFLLGENAEQTLENINNFKKTFDEAVNTAVKEKLRQDTPPASGGISKNKATSVAQLAEDSRLIK